MKIFASSQKAEYGIYGFNQKENKKISFSGYNFPIKKIKGLNCAYCTRRLIDTDKLSNLVNFFKNCNGSENSTNKLIAKFIELSQELLPKTKNKIRFLITHISKGKQGTPIDIVRKMGINYKNMITLKYMRAIFKSSYDVGASDKVISDIYDAYISAFKHTDKSDMQVFKNILSKDRFTKLYTDYMVNIFSDNKISGSEMKLNIPKNIKREYASINALTKNNDSFSANSFLKKVDSTIRNMSDLIISKQDNPNANAKEISLMQLKMKKLIEFSTNVKQRFNQIKEDPRTYFAFNYEESPEKFIGSLFSELMPTTDHIHPKSSGGIDHAKNYLLACTHCNTSRKDIEFKKFVQEHQLEKAISGHLEKLDAQIPKLELKAQANVLSYLSDIKITLRKIFGVGINPKTPNTDKFFSP